MTSIFICHGRDDQLGYARIICDALASQLGLDSFFLHDGDQSRIRYFDVVLALCYPSMGRSNRHQLPQDDAEAAVRAGIEKGLKFRKLVIPVLLEDAQMPALNQVSERHRAVLEQNVVRVRRTNLWADSEDLATRVRLSMLGTRGGRAWLETGKVAILAPQARTEEAGGALSVARMQTQLEVMKGDVARRAKLRPAVRYKLQKDGRDPFEDLRRKKVHRFKFGGALKTFFRRKDEVECSVFAPPVSRPGSSIIVQAFLHAEGEMKSALHMAARMDTRTELRACQPLSVNIKRGASVTVSLTADAGIAVDEPQVTVLWRGKPSFAQFVVRLPEKMKDEYLLATIRVSVDGGLVGCINFLLSIDPAKTLPSQPTGVGRRYAHAFISYASADRKEVLKRTQLLKATGISFFQDVLDLDPGDRWQPKIWEHLDRCDLFLLFWSQAAMKSSAVLQEAERAIARQNAGEYLDIVPVIIESPPPLPPPESLSALHFNDKIQYLVGAS